MKKISNQSGVGIIEVLLLIVVLGIVAFTGWFVWHSTQKSNDSLNSDTALTSGVATGEASKDISVNVSKLPEGWTLRDDSTGSTVIVGRQKVPGCEVVAQYSTDTSDWRSPSIDHVKRTLDDLNQKGEASMTGTGSLTLNTVKGTQVLTSYIFKQVVSTDETSYMEVAFAPTADYYAEVSLGCANQQDLVDAAKVIDALTFNHEI